MSGHLLAESLSLTWCRPGSDTLFRYPGNGAEHYVLKSVLQEMLRHSGLRNYEGRNCPPPPPDKKNIWWSGSNTGVSYEQGVVESKQGNAQDTTTSATKHALLHGCEVESQYTVRLCCWQHNMRHPYFHFGCARSTRIPAKCQLAWDILKTSIAMRSNRQQRSN